MRQPDHEYEERSFGDIQRAIDFENSMNDLESQLYYQHLSPKEVAQQVLKATCQFYDADWCGLIQVDLDLNLWTPFWWFNAGATDKTMLLTEEYDLISRIRIQTFYRTSWSCTHNCSDLHSLCYIIRMIYFIYKSCCKTDLVTI